MMLATRRLVLRPFARSDIAAYAAIRAKPEVVAMLPGGPEAAARAAADAERLVAAWAALPAGAAPWAAEEKESGRLLGHLGLRPLPELGGEIPLTIQTLFPNVCAIRRPDDADLESKIRRMADVDIAQVGIPIEGGMQGKRDLALRLNKGVDVFKKMGVASSPQEMLDILLSTQKAITEPESAPKSAIEIGQSEPTLPSNLTINADVLVSMLLIVVIRSSVRHLHARLLYMR